MITWLRAACVVLLTLPAPAGAAGATGGAGAAGLLTEGDWPPAISAPDIVEERVRFESRSPFVPNDVADAPAAEAVGIYVRPAEPLVNMPAVILLHGAGGVSRAREVTYARQFARQGVAALVIDGFAARRDLATGFTERLIRITESMLLADAYAGLEWLAAKTDVDGDRVALIGFSYGGMSSIFASYAQTAAAFAPGGARFAAHVAFYGPCIARFDEPETTAAPVLMLWGSGDEIIDPARCRDIASDLRVGGSRVEIEVYQDALHRWDAGRVSRWRAPRGLADCDLRVDTDGRVRDRLTYLPMQGELTRKLILANCSDSTGYLIGADEDVRRRSNTRLARFLGPILFPPTAGG